MCGCRRAATTVSTVVSGARAAASRAPALRAAPAKDCAAPRVGAARRAADARRADARGARAWHAAWQARHHGGSTMIALCALCLLPRVRFELVLLPQTGKSWPLNSKFESGLLPRFCVCACLALCVCGCGLSMCCSRTGTAVVSRELHMVVGCTVGCFGNEMH